MRNREQQIRELRTEVDILTRRIQTLSARVALLEQGKTPAAELPPLEEPLRRAEPEKKKLTNLESNVGKNLFAVLASLLVLIGVGVFISTIYERIPDVVKIIAIFVFGFALLAVGLAIHRRNGNPFWLGVASCGMAELLVSIITSHSYFGVLPLPGAFALILVWILGSLALTKVQTVVFKIIGYLGFSVSMALGLYLLEPGDLTMYLTLAGAFGVLSVFFLVTNRGKTVLNTVLAFGNAVNLCQFLDHIDLLSGELLWVRGVLALVILGASHVAYLRVAKLHKDAYPFFGLLSVWVLWLYAYDYPEGLSIPLMLGAILGLWYLSQRTTGSRTVLGWYTALGAIMAWIFSSVIRSVQWELMFWYGGMALGAYGLYLLTRKQTALWLGTAAYGLFYLLGLEHYTTPNWMFWVIFGGGAAFFVLHCLTQPDQKLRTAWYVLLFCMAHTLLDRWYENYLGQYQLWESANAAFYFVLTLANTAYLHWLTKDREKIMRISPAAVVILAFQLYLFIRTMDLVNSRVWYVAVLGVAGSLIPTAHSLWYTYKSKGVSHKLTVWQFVKFSLYIWVVLSQLDCPSILVNISLLILAIGAIVAGFRLGHKSVRVYGLVLSLVDVVSLVLFNIDYSDSLQLAGGIILCGALCFVISFIYSRISKSGMAKKA